MYCAIFGKVRLLIVGMERTCQSRSGRGELVNDQMAGGRSFGPVAAAMRVVLGGGGWLSGKYASEFGHAQPIGPVRYRLPGHTVPFNEAGMASIRGQADRHGDWISLDGTPVCACWF